MFMCKHCLEQYDDSHLAYTLVLESRANSSLADIFVMKFCSKAHLQDFLSNISHQQQHYVLTKHGPTEQRFEPDSPRELLLLVGSSRAS